MKRKEQSGIDKRMNSYRLQKKNEEDQALAKNRFNVPVLMLGLAYGAKSISVNGDMSVRVLIAGAPEEMVNRPTYGKDGPKVRLIEGGDGKPKALAFDARIPKTKPHLKSEEVKFVPFTTMVVRLNKGKWLDNIPVGAPMMICDVNASMGEGKNGVSKYINAGGAEAIDAFKGEKMHGMYPLRDLARAFARAGALTKKIAPFTGEMVAGGFYPDPGMVFIIPLGDGTRAIIEEEMGEPFPLVARVMLDQTKFSFKKGTLPTEPQHAFISTVIWCEPADAGDDARAILLKATSWDEEMTKFGFEPDVVYHSELLTHSVLPFMIHGNRIGIFSPNLARTNDLPENSAMVKETGDSPIESAYEGNLTSFTDYAGAIRRYGFPVTASWAKDFVTSEEVTRAAEVNDAKLEPKVEATAKLTLKTTGVIPMNVASKMTERVLKNIADNDFDHTKFFVMISELLVPCGGEAGVAAAAARAQALDVEDSTALVNYMMNGMSDENDLTEESKKIVDERLVMGLTGTNVPTFEKVALFAIRDPAGSTPVFDMFVHNVFRTKNAAAAKEEAETAE